MNMKLLLITALLTIGLTGCGGTDSGTKQTTAPAAVKTDAPAPAKTEAPPTPAAEPKKKENKPTISKDEFDAIENGMTYDEVTKIIGGPGEVISEVGKKGEQFYTVAYMFKGEGSTGANANFMFQEGKLETKAQFGLK